MLLLLISLIAGVLTVLAPCILPLLPVIIGGSLSEGGVGGFNKRKAFTIVLSLGLSVIAFTLLLKVSTLFIDIPEYVWKWISGSIVFLLGIVTLFPVLWEGQFMARLSAKSNILLGKGNQKNSFLGDVIMGAALGPVFSTCSPTYFIVLATVLPVSPALGMLYLLTYTTGLCLTLFLVSIVGQKIMQKLGVAADPRGWFKRILGIVFLIVGVAIIGGFDKKTQLFLLDSGFFDVTRIEQRLLEAHNTLAEISPVAPATVETLATEAAIIEVAEKDNTASKVPGAYLTLAQKQARYTRVPELSSIDGYVNTDGKTLTLASLRGKVVLLDIWTYSCINCQRTLPYINEWYAKYKDRGLEVVGLHTPEFAFEKVQANVEKAVKGFGIKYPVVLDNDYSTWNALGNQFWPRKYLVDIDGYIVYDHIGEGSYDETERAIQKALEERDARLGLAVDMPTDVSAPANVVEVDNRRLGSPETYFGASRNEFLANGKGGKSGAQTLVMPTKLSPNALYLGGTWQFTSEYAENTSPADIRYLYSAKNVYFVGSADATIRIRVTRDGGQSLDAARGPDVNEEGEVSIQTDRLYQLVKDMDYGVHTLEIHIPNPGLSVYTLTFG